MAKIFGKTLLSLVAACVASGVTLAQDVQETFKEAVRLIRINKPDEGLEKLREVLAADPSAEDAFETWKATDVYVWQMLLEQGGDYERIAKFLMERATLGRKEMSRDEGRIAELIKESQSKDFSVRSKANAELAANHAEFAVPQLLRILGDVDASVIQDRAMLTLFRIGRPAVLPLIEALKSDNDLLRRNAAAALVQIGDSRAAPALTELANDASEGVRSVAEAGMKEFGVAPGERAADLFLRDARAYLAGTGVRAGESSDVVWTWDAATRDVVSHDVPGVLYSFELAKARAQDAMRLDPANIDAQALVAQSYLAEAKAIEANADNPAMADMVGNVGHLRMVAMALGKDALEHAAGEAGFVDHADVIKALAEVSEDGTIGGTALVTALDSEDAPVRYAAALAIAQQSERDVPAAGKVVAVLGQAVTEEAIRAVLVIDGNPLTQKIAKEASARRGVAIREASTGTAGVADFYSFPNYDVVVVSEGIRDATPETVINLVRQRAPQTKVLLLATSEDAESRFGDKVDGIIASELALTPDQLIEKVNEVVDSLEARRARADSVATAAGEALSHLARSGVNVLPVIGELTAQLDREDRVAIPAVNALGAGATLEQTGALAGLLSRENASIELKQAAAEAIGDILGRSGSVPNDVLAALMKVAADREADLGLRQAAVTALGKGRVDAGTRLKLVEILKTIPSASGEM